MDSANPNVYMVTNVTSVLGKAIALGLARTGATVLIVANDRSHGAGVEQEISMASQNPNVELQLGDLSNLSSVRDLAEVINSKYEKIDGMILNNSVYRKQRSVTLDGFEEMFAANYLGPFLLTNLLLDRLRASGSARIHNLAASLGLTGAECPLRVGEVYAQNPAVDGLDRGRCGRSGITHFHVYFEATVQ